MRLEKTTSVKILTILFIALLVWSVIEPYDYFVWLLEISGVIFIISVYIYFNKSIQFTLTTNIWFFIAVCLITIGAHYSFPKMPLFDNAMRLFGSERNNYDKLAHVVQGVLPVLISWEVFVKKKVVHDIYWIYFLSFCIAVTVSGLYELVEWLFIILFGDTSYTSDVLGTQGYIWDAQTDILFAVIGAMLTIILGRKHLLSIVKKELPPQTD